MPWYCSSHPFSPPILSICFCLFSLFGIIPKKNTWHSEKIYCQILWWYQYFSYNKRSFIGPNCESYPINMCIVTRHWICFPQTISVLPSLSISNLDSADKNECCCHHVLNQLHKCWHHACEFQPNVHVHTQPHAATYVHTVHLCTHTHTYILWTHHSAGMMLFLPPQAGYTHPSVSLFSLDWFKLAALKTHTLRLAKLFSAN